MKEYDMKMPKSALALYVKLYCRRNAANRKKVRSTNDQTAFLMKQNILIEATKAWVTLSKTDKQFFYKLFDEYEAKLKRKFASNLQNAQPYMRKKTENISRYDADDNNDDKEECNDLADSHLLTTDHQKLSALNHHSSSLIEDNDRQNHIEHFQNCNTIIPMQSITEPISTLTSEPTPPVKSSKELFEVIKYNNQDNMLNDKWTDLSKIQKQRYQRALSTIKNEYIKQYTIYLQQLSHKELFEHYKSKF